VVSITYHNSPFFYLKPFLFKNPKEENHNSAEGDNYGPMIYAQDLWHADFAEAANSEELSF